MAHDMIGLKIQIYPTDEQKKIFNQYFGVARYVYNYGINEVEKEYKETGNHISKYELGVRFTEFKHQEENSWLLNYDANTMKLVIFDVDKAYRFFFNKNEKNRCPKLKKKKTVYQQYPIRPERMSIHNGYIRIPGIKTDIACGNIPHNYCIGKGHQVKTHPDYRKYRAARIIYDGLNYYLGFEMDITENINIASYEKYHDDNKSKTPSDTIGIDFGFSKNNWIVDSNGNRISLPDDHKEQKKIKHFQRKMNRQLRTSKTKKRSKRLERTIREINKYYKKISNRKDNVIHNYISHEIIQRKPLAVVIEDIHTSDFYMTDKSRPLFARKYFNTNINDHKLNDFQVMLEYKCVHNGIPLIRADREFPSTKRCSSCGNIQEMGRKKIYRCPVCGMTMNRDDNAAKNLSQYPSLAFIGNL